jgi:hypothetical protein
VAEDEKQEPAGANREASAEKEAEEAARRLREIKVQDLLVQAVSGLVSLGFVRLAGDQKDLAQARLAIDSLRALEPVVRDQMSAELAGELQQALASLQLSFTEVVDPAGRSEAPSPGPENEDEEPVEGRDPGSDG